MNYQKEVKDWAAGLYGREYNKGLITKIGPKWVTWLSLYEGERPRQVSTEDFHSVVVKGEGENGRSFGDLLIDEDRNRYRNDASRAAGIMGASKSAKKAAASRENGKKGGRPPVGIPEWQGSQGGYDALFNRIINGRGAPLIKKEDEMKTCSTCGTKKTKMASLTRIIGAESTTWHYCSVPCATESEHVQSIKDNLIKILTPKKSATK